MIASLCVPGLSGVLAVADSPDLFMSLRSFCDGSSGKSARVLTGYLGTKAITLSFEWQRQACLSAAMKWLRQSMAQQASRA